MTTFSSRELIETFIRNYALLFSFFFFLFSSLFFLTLFQLMSHLFFPPPPRVARVFHVFVKLRDTTIRRFWNNGWHGYAILWNYFVQFTATSTGPVMSVHRRAPARYPILLPTIGRSVVISGGIFAGGRFQLSCNNRIAGLFSTIVAYGTPRA